MSVQVTATYIGTGVNSGDVLILLQDPVSGASTNSVVKFQSDSIANCFQWQVVSTAGSVTVEITYDGTTWFPSASLQDLTGTSSTTYVTSTTVSKPAVFYGSVRGIRVKQNGLTAATAQLFGWSYGQYG